MTRHLTLLLACAISLGACGAPEMASDAASGSRPNATDIGFLQAMSLHHEQAILMAQIVRERRLGGAAEAVARAIEGSQLIELGQMKGWLQLWRQSLLPGPSPMDWMKPDGADAGDVHAFLAICGPGAGMPGAVTAQQFDALRSAEPDAAAPLFLRLMIRHHQGGLPMARYAAAHAATRVVRQFAGQIVVEQSLEAGRLSTLLTAAP